VGKEVGNGMGNGERGVDNPFIWLNAENWQNAVEWEEQKKKK